MRPAANPPSAQVAPNEATIPDILRAINRHRLLIIAIIMAIMALAVMALGMVKPVYRAEAVLLIAPTETLSNDDVLHDVEVGDANAVIESQIRILGSSSLAGEVIRAADLSDWTAESEARLVRFWGEPLSEANDSDALIVRYLAGLQVVRDGKSNAIKVAFTSTDPKRAAQLANATVDRYLESQLSRKAEANQRATGWLREQVLATGLELEAAESALEAYREATREKFGDTIAVHGADVANLKRDMAAASADRAALQVELRQVKEQADLAALEPDTATAFEDLGGSPVLQNLFALKNQVVRREAELATQYGERHPLIIDVRNEKVELDKRILLERDAMVGRVAGELERAQVREQTLKRELDELAGQTIARRDAEIEIAALEREVALSRTLYDDYVQRFQAVADRDHVQLPDGRVLSPAVAPTRPLFPRPALTLGTAAIAAIATALVIVFLLEQSEHGFRTAAALERAFGLPCLGLVPLARPERSADLDPHDLVKERPRSRFAEALRGLLAVIGPTTDSGKVVLLCSALPQEGKSTTSISLARVASGDGLRTILIDADLRRPRLQAMLGEPIAPGLIEVLRGDVPLERALRADRGAGEPDVLLGARRTDLPLQALGQGGMRELLADLRQRYDLILIDTAPLAAVADARMLAVHADTALVLTRWNGTPQALVEQAIRSLREAGGTVAGTVLTQVDIKKYAMHGSAEARLASSQLAAYYEE